MDSEGTFLRHAKGLTIRDNSDKEVQIVTIGSADKVRGYYYYLCDINLMDGIKIFSFKNSHILIFRPNLYTCEEPAP